MIKTPLVSCLCISYNRAFYLKGTILNFLEQTYPNKELIIISREYSEEYEAIISCYADSPVKYYVINDSADITLGEMRNVAIEKSTGEYFCIWDDDDWHHCRRVEIQMREVLKNKKQGSVLPFCLLFNSITGEASLSKLVIPPASILCKKSAITASLLYPSLNRGEDSVFLKKLFANNILFPVVNPTLYIYVYHGNNTTNGAIFDAFHGGRFSQNLSGLIKDVVENRISYKEGSKLLGRAGVLAELDYFKGMLEV